MSDLIAFVTNGTIGKVEVIYQIKNPGFAYGQNPDKSGQRAWIITQQQCVAGGTNIHAS